MGDFWGAFPQGRNVAQAQFSDDFSIVKHDHNLKIGIDLRHEDVPDHGLLENTHASRARAKPWSAPGAGTFADLAPGFPVAGLYANAPYPHTSVIRGGTPVGPAAVTAALNPYQTLKYGFASGGSRQVGVH